MGMMTATNSEGVSLAIIITNGLLSISTERTLPLFTWISAAILNFFIPSGGGQWAVQAPIMLPAAMEKGVSLATVSTALLWGDAWTNLIQPFWALPALGVAGLAAKDIMGYLVIVLIATGIVIAFSLLVLYPLFG
jgi:short-chain fatty acids transporter